MTDEDKKIVADYMEWDGTTTVEGYAIPTPEIHHFDLNDAGLVVAEMQKRGEFDSFDIHSFHRSRANGPKYVAWLFNADNFFDAFVAWRRTK